MSQHNYDEVAIDKVATLSPPAAVPPPDTDLPYQEPIPSPVLGSEEGYTTLLEKYQERGREIKALRKINNQLEVELKQAKAELETLRAGKRVPKVSDSGYAAITDKDTADYAEVNTLEERSPTPQQDEVRITSEHCSSPSDNESLPTSPIKRNSLLSPTSETTAIHLPYARVDLAKKAYERQKKEELERRWRLNSTDEPNKEELNACVKKITTNIYALLEASKGQDKANFSQCRDLDGTGIYEMAQKCSLKVLKVSDLKLQSLLCLDKLQHNLIELEINSVCSSIDRSTLLHVGKFKVISELTLYSVTLLNDDIVAKIFSSIGHQLTKLHLLNCPELKDISESLVKYCTSLQDLLITGDCLSIQLTSLFTDKWKASLFKAIQLYNDTVPIEVVEAVAASCHNLERLYCEIEINDNSTVRRTWVFTSVHICGDQEL
ncbi:uncharacterized protein [Dysidea avara]|uniref:uncharacterized protein n=1 Tax=Dysidea avara TaxID=196820 RepID=UPI00331D1284